MPPAASVRSIVAARAARWRPLVEAVIEAVALARADEDPDRMAHAAASLTRYSAWLPQEYEEVHEDLVEDLRWGLRELDHHDSATRCTRTSTCRTPWCTCRA